MEERNEAYQALQREYAWRLIKLSGRLRKAEREVLEQELRQLEAQLAQFDPQKPAAERRINPWAHVPLLDLIKEAGCRFKQRYRDRKTGREKWRGDHACAHGSKSGTCLYVIPEAGFWHCTSCGQKGNAVDWVMSTHGLTYAEAVRWLEERYGPAPTGRADLPSIDVGIKDLRLLTRWAWEAIEKANAQQPRFFRYGNVLVRLERDATGRLIPVELTPPRMRHHLARVANWVRKRVNGENGQRQAQRELVPPPAYVVQDVLADPDPPLPILTNIVEVPFFDPDGVLVSRAGYHNRCKTFLDLPEELKIPPVPVAPTAADVAEARRLIEHELLGDFPFVDNDKAHAVGLLLLPFARELIQGPTPIHLVEAPTEGSGKTLLTEVCLYPFMGDRLTASPPCRDDEEIRKRITALLWSGRHVVWMDNVGTLVNSGALSSAITARLWEDRTLGRSETLRIPIRAVWVMTGNNVAVSREIMRRMIRIRLDPKMAEPWRRQNFRHPNLRAWVRANRERLIWAALVLIQNWLAKGRPSYTGQVLGGFESWSEVIGGILQAAGIEGFLANLDDFYRSADQELNAWLGFVEAWWERFQDNPVLARDLVPVALSVEGFELGGKDDTGRTCSLGRLLHRRRDCVIGRFRIVRAGTDSRAVRWRLQPWEEKPPGGDSPTPGDGVGEVGEVGEVGTAGKKVEFCPNQSGEDPPGSAQNLGPSTAVFPHFGGGGGAETGIVQPPLFSTKTATKTPETALSGPDLATGSINIGQDAEVGEVGPGGEGGGFVQNWDGSQIPTSAHNVGLQPPVSPHSGGRFGAESGVSSPPHFGQNVSLKSADLTSPTSPTSPGPVIFIETPAGLGQLLQDMVGQPVIALDLETVGKDPHQGRIRVVSVAASGKPVYVVDISKVPIAGLRPLLSDKRSRFLFHNGKFDLKFLMAAGYELVPGWVYDTMLADQILRGGQPPRALDELAAELGELLDKRMQKARWDQELTPAMIDYAAKDAAALLKIYAAQKDALKQRGLDGVADLEFGALLTISWMEYLGVPFDEETWRGLSLQAGVEMNQLRKKLDQLARPFVEAAGLWDESGINWESPAQVRELLARMGLDLPNTAEPVLAAHRDKPIVGALLAFREACRLYRAYGQRLVLQVNPATRRIHPNWHQIGAASGRMACSEPNLQNIPRRARYRACFKARPGRILVKADYDQIELRMAAQIAKDKRMLAAYKQNIDLHSFTAQYVVGKNPVTPEDRQTAKALNFGLLYGMGAKGLKQYALDQFGIDITDEQAAQWRSRFFSVFAGLARWHKEMANSSGEMRTLSGRWRSGDLSYTERLNTPVQGSVADGLKNALYLLWARRHQCPDAVPILAVHDEIVIECDENNAEKARDWLIRCMEEGMAAFLSEVPVVVKAVISKDWSGGDA